MIRGLSKGYTFEVNTVTEEQWSEILTLFDDATIYQTWAYGSVCWGEDQLNHCVLKKDGSVVAAAQIRIVQVPMLNCGIAYMRWAPLWRARAKPWDPVVLPEMMSAVRDHYAKHGRLQLRVVPYVYSNDTFRESFASVLRDVGMMEITGGRDYRSSRVDLSLSIEELRQRLHKRWRGHLNGAEKSGLHVIEGSSAALYDRFAKMYGEMMSRKRFETSVDIAEFRAIQDRLASGLKMQIFVCERQSEALNALVVSRMGDSGIYLLAATSDAGLEARGAHLLQWRAIQWLKQEGCRWYDLGGINADGNPGVYQFKNGIGGEDVTQLHRYEVSDSWWNQLCIRAGERLQAVRPRLTGLLARR